jgi:hypothetical protein
MVALHGYTTICYSTHPIDKYQCLNPLYGINGEESTRQGAVVSAPHTRISFNYYSLLSRVPWICWRHNLQTYLFLRNLSSDLVVVSMGPYYYR